jgi:hypothetical protein
MVRVELLIQVEFSEGSIESEIFVDIDNSTRAFLLIRFQVLILLVPVLVAF